MKEVDVLDKSMLSIQQLFHQNFEITTDFIANPNLDYDGFLLIGEEELPFIVKNQLNLSMVKQTIFQIQNIDNQDNKPIFIADYIDKKIGEYLKTKGWFYFDILGNCYLDLPNLKVFVEGKMPKITNRIRKKRSFQKTGLILLFHLLTNPKLLNHAYSQISKVTGVSKGTISYVFEELQTDNYLVLIGKEKKWNHAQKLIQKWANHFNEHLRNTIHRGYFKSMLNNENTIVKALIMNDEYCIGGEFGAEQLDKLVNPQQLIIYTNKRIKIINQAFKIYPTETNDENSIIIYEAFWLKNETEILTQKSFPLLIYADLFESDNSRNIIIADKILNDDIYNSLKEYTIQW